MPQKSVKVYTTSYCPYCAKAKQILTKKSIPFEEIDVTGNDQKRQEVQDRYGWMTVPIIVIGDQCIGGADELAELDKKGKLNALLGL